MNSLKSVKIPSPLVLVFLCCLALFLFFGKFLLNPNAFLFSAWGDGIKNYYTPAYYVKHDQGKLFSGMNYPYGENPVFADSQPAVAFTLNWITRNLWDISDYTIGVLNFLMLISILVCAVFVFFILKHYLLPSWFAVPVALIIAFLSPQIERISGHFSLAYCMVVPMIWYFTIKLMEGETRKWAWTISLTAILSIFSFVHVYYLFIGVLFLSAVAFVFLLLELKRINLNTLVCLLFSIVVPFAIFKLFLHFTSPATDRIESPYGFFAYSANFQSIFLPRTGFLLQTVKAKQPNIEAMAYVGFLGLPILMLNLFRWVSYISKSQWRKLAFPSLPGKMRIFLWASVLTLLFSMAIPFGLGLEGLLEKLGPLKQFRSPGRLAWVFYYVFSVYAAFVIFSIYRRMRTNQLRKMAAAFLVIVLIYWGLDAFTHVRHQLSYIGNPSDSFYDKNILSCFQNNGVSPSDFQAILPLPYYNNGSEKLYIENSALALVESCKTSFHTGLPIATVFMSRTSISQAFKSAQLFSSESINKTMVNDLPNDKPFLLVKTKELLQPYEKRLLDKSEFLFECDQVAFYRVPLSVFNDSIEYHFDSYCSQKNALTPHYGFMTDTRNAFVYSKNFDEVENQYALFGQGGVYQEKGKLVLFDDNLETEKDSVGMNVSIWVKSNPLVASFPILHYYQFNPVGNLVDQKIILGAHSVQVFGDWLEMNIDFVLQKKENRIRIYLDGKKINADELLIRQKDINVYKHPTDTSVVLNNFLLSSQKSCLHLQLP